MATQKFKFELEIEFRTATKKEIVEDTQLLDKDEFEEYDAELDMRDNLHEEAVKKALKTWLENQDINDLSEDFLWDAPTNWFPLKSIKIK